jgi:hypothetical protein
MDQPATIHDVVAATLRSMGLCRDPASLIRTILLRDCHFIGHKYRFDGGYAAWVAETNIIEVYDGDGKLLTTFALGTTEGGEAA